MCCNGLITVWRVWRTARQRFGLQESIKLLQEKIGDCKTVVWNGPMGAVLIGPPGLDAAPQPCRCVTVSCALSLVLNSSPLRCV